MRKARLSLLSFLYLLSTSIADPIPVPHPDAKPEPVTLPEALAEAEAKPQTYSNNAPFSGAIYIVNPNGQGVTTSGTNMCPSYASVSCSSIGQPSYCCPNTYTCGSASNLIGCCPPNQSCGGSFAAGAAVTTITIQSAPQQTSYVYANPQPTQVVTQYSQPTQQAGPYQQGFCSTLTASGPGLPTTRQGSCGVILVVSEAVLRAGGTVLGVGVGGLVVGLYVGWWRMFGG